MGMEFVVDNLEDMCALMCDNRIPKQRGKMPHTETLDSKRVNISSEDLKPPCEAGRKEEWK